MFFTISPAPFKKAKRVNESFSNPSRALGLSSINKVRFLEFFSKKALNKLLDVWGIILKKDGLALITVWDKWQLKFLFRKRNRG